MSIYFVRHGQTDWNLHGRLQGQSDIFLNDTGIVQARDAKQQLNNIKIDRIICSPLARAKQTASILNENWNIIIHEDERLMERSFGKLEGSYHTTWKDVALWVYDSEDEHLFQMEPIKSFFQRVYACLKDVQDIHPEENILIVAHGGVSIPFACYFDHTLEKADLSQLILKNCEIAKV